MVGGTGGLTDSQASTLAEYQSRAVQAQVQNEKYSKFLTRHQRVVALLDWHKDSLKGLATASERKARRTQLRKRSELLTAMDKAAKPTVRPLTEKQEAEVAALIEKRDAPFELGSTAKAFVLKTWLQYEH
jgi:hypothetical protein